VSLPKKPSGFDARKKKVKRPKEGATKPFWERKQRSRCLVRPFEGGEVNMD